MISGELEKMIETVGGDATLVAYSMENGALRLHMESYDDEDVFITVRTDTIRLDVSDDHTLMRYVYLRLTYLADILNQEHGIYVPSSDFGHMMQETRKGASLVYGRRLSEVKWLLSVVGSHAPVICTVRAPEDVTWTVK